MSKIKTTVFSVLMSLFLLCGALAFSMPNSLFSVKAEGEDVKYSLLPSTYNEVPSETLSKYNIATAQTHSFTPFDFEAGTRMSGMGFVFPTQERNQIENEYVLLDQVEDVNLNQELSLNLWIYFSTIYLHDLTITIELENSSTISWLLTSTQLYSLLSSTGSLAVDNLPYGYVRFDLPFNVATINGAIESNGNLISPTKMTINFTSLVTEVDNFSNLVFYDVYLTESADKERVSVEKQGYRFYSLNFFDQEIADGLVVGDSLTIPTKSKAISYAWDGDSDLYALSNKQTPYVQWKVLVKSPSSENNIEYKNFGEKITFTEEGIYQIYYQCYNTSLSNENAIISASVTLNVKTMNAVVFGTSLTKIEVGKTYTLYLSSSSVFSSVSDFRVTSTDGLDIEYLGNGVVEITATKKGDYKLTASVDANRVVDTTIKEYSSSIDFEAVEVDQDDNMVLKIVLWSVLGIIVVVLVITMIKSLVKSNKNDVK